MAEKKQDENRILNYVNGLLYFYGVMDFEALYKAVTGTLKITPDRDTIKRILEKELSDYDSSYEFDFEDGLYSHIDVMGINRVYNEQKTRPDIPYRPVTEKEAHLVTTEQYHQLWTFSAKRLYRSLMDDLGRTADDARREIVSTQDAIRNGMSPLELVKFFLSENDTSETEIQPIINMIMEMSNHTPLWILKGWTPDEVFRKYEKPALMPLPDTPFKPGPEKEIKAAPKTGRNEPCPCGSGKKYKKCCITPVSETTEKVSTALRPDKKEAPPRREPTFEEWRALYEAAVTFRDLACWEWMDEDNLFGVMDPETEEIAYCCITGAMGDLFGVGGYLGSEGLNTLLAISNDESDWVSRELFLNQRSIAATFENRKELLDEEIAVIEELGLKFRGKKQWPQFTSYEPGFAPWFINDWECRFLTHILQQSFKVALRCRWDRSILHHEKPFTFLVRVPTVKDGELIWSDRYLEAEPPKAEYISINITDEVLLKKLLSLKTSKNKIWEADTFYHPEPVQDNKNERPYFPKVFLLAEKQWTYFKLRANV